MNYNLISHDGFNTFKSYSNLLYQFVKEFIEQKQEHLSFDSFMEAIQETAEDLAKQGYDHGMKMDEGVTPEEFKARVAAKVKGDIFEIFTMFTMQYFHNVPNIMGIKENTYKQIPDEEDAGVDFIGTVEFNEKRAFGQIKFRNPLNTSIDDKSMATAFTRTTIEKLIGNAVIKYHFKEEQDYAILVTNLKAEKAIYYRAKEEINFVNNKTDLEHDYIKIIDQSVFNSLISIDNIAFWNCFLNAIGE